MTSHLVWGAGVTSTIDVDCGDDPSSMSAQAMKKLITNAIRIKADILRIFIGMHVLSLFIWIVHSIRKESGMS